ncbi:hypothetical protein K491DRAFT_675831 [Lophiostoma macrostomum CBS 122681]|uniref:Uncharacterized protein n=1 Tax=Lophiostoma macrostomum CBS 122681 TaxID=1314788 RepID=A0A6A6TGU8_9PLEO|nr:hypothetical protein K491DRAFT_675831 [Lophiostoma macrostomum CBS 122681]
MSATENISEIATALEERWLAFGNVFEKIGSVAGAGMSHSASINKVVILGATHIKGKADIVAMDRILVAMPLILPIKKENKGALPELVIEAPAEYKFKEIFDKFHYSGSDKLSTRVVSVNAWVNEITTSTAVVSSGSPDLNYRDMIGQKIQAASLFPAAILCRGVETGMIPGQADNPPSDILFNALRRGDPELYWYVVKYGAVVQNIFRIGDSLDLYLRPAPAKGDLSEQDKEKGVRKLTKS